MMTNTKVLSKVFCCEFLHHLKQINLIMFSCHCQRQEVMATETYSEPYWWRALDTAWFLKWKDDHHWNIVHTYSTATHNYYSTRLNFPLQQSIIKLPHYVQVCVYFNHQLFRGNRCTKVSSTSFGAYNSPNMSPLATFGMNVSGQPHNFYRITMLLVVNIAMYNVCCTMQSILDLHSITAL